MARSEKRQRTKDIRVRVTPEEYERVKLAADNTGLSLGAFARACMLDNPGPRATRKPPVARQELTRILGQLGKIGSNVNQIARAINSGDAPHGLTDDIKAAVVAIADIHEAAAHALGWKSTGADE